MGEVLIEERKYEEAISYYKEAMELEPNHPEVYNKIGAAMFAQKKFDLAEKYYLKALRIDPNLLNAQNNIGIVYFYQGNASKALKHYAKGFAENPDFAEYAEAYINVGNILIWPSAAVSQTRVQN